MSVDQRAEFVFCGECGWTLKNNDEFDLVGERCGYKGCNNTFDAIPNRLLDLTRRNWDLAYPPSLCARPANADSDPRAEA